MDLLLNVNSKQFLDIHIGGEVVKLKPDNVKELVSELQDWLETLYTI